MASFDMVSLFAKIPADLALMSFTIDMSRGQTDQSIPSDQSTTDARGLRFG